MNVPETYQYLDYYNILKFQNLLILLYIHHFQILKKEI
jgi:hypothetical protein